MCSNYIAVRRAPSEKKCPVLPLCASSDKTVNHRHFSNVHCLIRFVDLLCVCDLSDKTMSHSAFKYDELRYKLEVGVGVPREAPTTVTRLSVERRDVRGAREP